MAVIVNKEDDKNIVSFARSGGNLYFLTNEDASCSLFSVQEQADAVRIELLQVAALMWCILLAADIIAVSYLYAKYGSYLRKLYHSGLGCSQVTSKLCNMVVSPLLLCRGVMLLVGIITLAMTGEYAVLLVNLFELLLVIAMTLVQKKLIERSV